MSAEIMLAIVVWGSAAVITGFWFAAVNLGEWYRQMFDSDDEPEAEDEFEPPAPRREPAVDIETIVRREAA
jgi:hypothetical protein